MSGQTLSIRRIGWSMAGGVLAVPAIAMLFTSQVNWGPGDFLAAALLLGSTGVFLEIVAALPRRRWRSIGTIGGLAALVLIWAELAVGIVH